MKRRREWTLSPRDLPDPTVIKDEPLLADLENNAAFRMLVFRQHASISELSTSRITGCGILVTLLIFTPYMSAPLVLVVVAWIIFTQFFRPSAREPDGPYLLGLDHRRFAELHQTGVGGEAVVGGLWAMLLPRTGSVRAYRQDPLVLGALLLTTPFFVSTGWLWFTTPFIYFVAREWKRRKWLPHVLLPQVDKILSNAAMAARGGEARFFAGCAQLSVFLYLCVLLGMVVVLGVSMIVGLNAGSLQRIYDLLLLPWAVFVGMTASVLGGLFFGDRQGRKCRAERELWLRAMKPHLDGLIERAGEEPPVN